MGALARLAAGVTAARPARAPRRPRGGDVGGCTLGAMRAPMLVLAVVLSCGCGSAGGARAPAGPTVEPAAARREAEALLGELHASLRRGAPANVLPLLAEDVLLVGPGPQDVVVERGAAIDLLASLAPAGRKHRVKARAVHAVAAPGGRAAWATEELQLGRATYAVTVVAAEVDELWTIVALQVSSPVADRKARAAARSGRLAAPEAPPAPPASAAAPEVEQRFAEALAGREAMGGQLAERADVLAVGSAGARLRGADKVRKAWKKAAGKGELLVARDGARSGVTPDGALAWVLGGVDVTRGGGPALPQRVLALYERGPAGWALVAVHEAVPSW